MHETPRRADALTLDDLKRHAVWRFVNDDSIGETAVLPVKRIPVKDLAGKLVGTQVRLGNGWLVWALIGNVVTDNARLNKHFVTVSIEHDGRWFELARYHDIDYEQRGPKALASFLGLPVDQVFPIAFDLRPFSRGDVSSLVGTIDVEPSEKLSRQEIIALAVSS